jgi:hypothetical protein
MDLVIDETRRDIEEIISKDQNFGFPPQSDIDRAFLDWLHFRARRIPCRPRQVIISRQVQSKLAAYPAIDRIRSALRHGDEVSAWLSRKLISGARSPRSDMMFNDWQITHFHLSRVFSEPNMISGTRDLLFAHVTSQCVTFLDVRPHNVWAAQDFLRILLQTRPDAMDRMEVKGALPPYKSYTDDELLQARMGGVSVPIIAIDGRPFMLPGIVSSGHAERIVRFYNSLERTIRFFIENTVQNKLDTTMELQIASLIGVPVRLGISFDPCGAFLIYDKNRNLPIHQTGLLE